MHLLYLKITFPIDLIISLIFGFCYLVQLLDDGINNDDQFDRDIYAEAMAETIKMIKFPLTIGIFGSWGSEKSFFLKMIKGI